MTLRCFVLLVLWMTSCFYTRIEHNVMFRSCQVALPVRHQDSYSVWSVLWECTPTSGSPQPLANVIPTNHSWLAALWLDGYIYGSDFRPVFVAHSPYGSTPSVGEYTSWWNIQNTVTQEFILLNPQGVRWGVGFVALHASRGREPSDVHFRHACTF